LLKNLNEIDRENTYSLYLKRGIFDLRKQPPRFEAANFSVKKDYFKRGVGSVLGNYDVYHAPAPELIDFGRPPAVVTIHDLIFKTYPKGHTKDTIDGTDRQMSTIVENAAKIICCSQNTFKDLKTYFPRGAEKASVIYEGVDRSSFFPVADAERGQARAVLERHGVQGDYILFVGTIEPRKNLANLLRAFFFLKEKKKFNGRLVVIGMKGWLSEWVSALVDQLNIKNDVVFTGYVAGDELRYFYSQAKAYVFPSFYEGFGLPILEAFACGVPVVTSDVSSCPEVAGNAAVTVDPGNIEEISEGIASVVNDSKKSFELVQKGFKRLDAFSFRRMAEETLGVYKSVKANQ